MSPHYHVCLLSIKKDQLTTLLQRRVCKSYSDVGSNTNCSQTLRVTHGSRPDEELSLWDTETYGDTQSVERPIINIRSVTSNPSYKFLGPKKLASPEKWIQVVTQEFSSGVGSGCTLSGGDLPVGHDHEFVVSNRTEGTRLNPSLYITCHGVKTCVFLMGLFRMWWVRSVENKKKRKMRDKRKIVYSFCLGMTLDFWLFRSYKIMILQIFAKA